MKKITKYLAVASIGLLMTGCGAKKMTCSYSSSDSWQGDSSQKIVYEFSKDGKKINKITKTQEASYTKKYLDYMDDKYNEDIEDAFENLEEECEDYDDVDFVSCKAKMKGNKISMTITYDLKGLDEDDLEDMYDDDDISSSIYYEVLEYLDNDYDDIVKDAKDSSNKYTCK